MHEFYFSAEIIDWFWSNVRSVLAQYINIFTILFLISEWWFWLFHDFFSSRHNRLILIQFFDPFWRKPMHHNQSKLLFPFIYSRSIYFISAAFSQSVTTFHLLQQNSKMEKYLIEISFYLFRLVEMFEICSRTSVMATTYCHCSKCSRAKYWYVLFSRVSWHFDNFFNKILKISFSQSN